MSKILFLDFDGVLNSETGWRRDKPEDSYYVTPECVDAMKWVFEQCPDVWIVVSSTWRYHLQLPALQAMLIAIGLPGDKVVGYTPMRMSADGPRGNEIQEYLDDHPEVTGFVIVDDNDDMVHLTKHLVHTNVSDGLTDINAADIVARFKAMK